MADINITIIGTGLVGTSFGLALKAAKVHGVITGHDKILEQAKAAQKAGALDKVQWNLPAACEGADLVILAIPLSEIPATLEAIAEVLRPDAVVVDTATLKAPVQAWVLQYLPGQVHYVGINPILTVGLDAEPSAYLFQGRTIALCPGPTANSNAVDLVSELISGVGATPLFLDIVEHDGLVAAVEQLPLLLGAALFSVSSTNDGWRDRRRLAGVTFADHTDFGEDSTAAATAWRFNRQNLVVWLERLQGEIGLWQHLLAEEDEEVLATVLERLSDERRKWLHMREKNEWGERLTSDVEKSAFSVKQFLFGSWGDSKRKK